MKTKLLKLILLMLMLVGTFISCKNEDVFDRKTIVGKWEPILIGYSGDQMIPVDSTWADIEYFSNGTRGYYDSATNEIKIAGNYQIRSGLLIYNYDKSIELGRHEYKCEFSHNNNQLKLTYVNGITTTILDVYVNPNIIIYQRIK